MASKAKGPTKGKIEASVEAAAQAAPPAALSETTTPDVPASAVEGRVFADAAAHDIQERLKEGTEDMATQTAEAGNAATDRFQAVLGDANGRAKVAVEKGQKLVEDLTDLTKGNVEALVESSKIAARGMETLGQEAADYGRRSFEEASAALKSFAEVKSPTDFFKLQGDFARSAFDGWVAQSSKASEAVIKLAGEVAEPITTRYSVAAERVKNAAAF